MSASLAPIGGPAGWSFTSLGPAVFTAASLVAVPAVPAGPARTDPLLDVQQPLHPGDAVPTFGFDFFDRVHYSWVLYELGNVIGQQQVALTVWNAHRRAERLLAFTPANDEGITVTGGHPGLPFDYSPLLELTYTFTVGTDGPGTIEASYTFDWQTADGVVRLTGSRITAWSFVPDWSSGIVERFEWRTDILRAYSGREQRRALRLAPRKAAEFDVFFLDDDRRYAEAVIFGWGARTWALPVWQDGQQLAAPVAAGGLQIMLETAGRDFAAGSLLVLLHDARTFEVVEVEEVLADRVALARPLASTWPAGTTVWPAREARIDGDAALARWSGQAGGMRLAFSVAEPVDHEATAPAATYRGAPVLEWRPNWTAAPEWALERKVGELDNGVSLPAYEDEAGVPFVRQRMWWTLASLAEVTAMRGLLYWLRGRHRALWVPTWADDLVVVAQIDLAATAVEVRHMDYVRQVAQATGRRDLRIQLQDGTVLYRRVTGSAQISTTVERLTIDAALGRTVQPAEIVQVSFLALMRLDSDAAELAFWTGEVADVPLVFKGFQHDL